MSQTLHPFQMNLYDRVRATRARGHRIIVVQGATGCGKNTIAAYFASKCHALDKHALLMVHRRRLVDQISERLALWDVPHGVLMRGESLRLYQNVQVASRDTLMSRCMNNEWIGMPKADLIIVDEAHHAYDPNSQYRRILANYPAATILLLSATPVGPDGRGLGPWAQAIECAAPTSQLVKDRYLVPVRCYAPDRKTRGNKYIRGMAGDLVESWKEYAEDRPTVLFTSRVQHSLDAVAEFNGAGIMAAHVDADTPDDVRDKAFNDVASGKIKVLSNVGIIGEGVDVPELSCCQLFCECNSRTRFLQAVGRVMRPAPGKEYGILIDHSGAVFKHGFPDEDTEWTLEGNVDEAFAAKHKAGLTEKAKYCKHCELAYHGQDACPQCGRMPVKPPRSIFAPPPAETREGEILVEADRNIDTSAWSRDMKIKTWFACLAVAKKRNGTFGMAMAMYRRKYNEWPADDFPCHPGRGNTRSKVTDIYPDFGKRRSG